MELPPGVRCHADMVRKLADRPLELSEVLPLYLHRYAILTNCPDASPGVLISKFREVDSQFFGGVEVHRATPELLYLADLIDPPTLRLSGFNAYLRREFSDFADEFPERAIPDLWFELESLKGDNRFGFRGQMIGLIEIVESSDISPAKWEKLMQLAQVLDDCDWLWICILRREVHAAFFTCEFLGP